MKIQKIILGIILALLTFSNVAHANHLIGGDVEYKFVKKAGTDSVQYLVTVKVYANYEQTAKIFNNGIYTISVGIYQDGSFPASQKELYRAIDLPVVDSSVVKIDG